MAKIVNAEAYDTIPPPAGSDPLLATEVSMAKTLIDLGRLPRAQVTISSDSALAKSLKNEDVKKEIAFLKDRIQKLD